MSSSDCPGPGTSPWSSTPRPAVPMVPVGHPRPDCPLAVSEPFDLLAIPTSVRMARWHATDVLRRWGLVGELEWPVLQALSELFGNCSNYAAGMLDAPPAVCTVTLRLFWDALCVEVRDPWPEPPMPQNPSFDDESGRGLRIVAALSMQVKILPTRPGKTVVAVIPRES